MRGSTILPLLLWAASGCRSCPEDVDLSTPAATLESFRDAFACDAKALEFRCFSDAVKERFNGYPGYTVGRQVFRDENQGLVLLLRFADLEDRLRVEPDPAGDRATAFIDGGDRTIEVQLVNEPEYRLFHPDGHVTLEYAAAVRAEPARPGQVMVWILDPDLTDLERLPILGVEIRSRWVIAGLPGLDAALSASRAAAP